MRFGDLTYQEIRELSRNKAAVVVIPTGCTEQQGPHLTVDFDSWFVEDVCVESSNAALERFDVASIILPTLPIGPTPEHRSFGHGFIDLGQDLHEAVVQSMLHSVADQGFKRFVVWRGCGQHDLRKPVESFNADQFGRAWAYLPEMPYSTIWKRVADPAVPGGHTDSFATSIALFRRPDHVRGDEIRKPKNRPVEWPSRELDFAEYSDTGAIGDPTYATSELGERLWSEVVGHVAEVFRFVSTASENGLTDG